MRRGKETEGEGEKHERKARRRERKRAGRKGMMRDKKGKKEIQDEGEDGNKEPEVDGRRRME